jgi:hypothetical protein
LAVGLAAVPGGAADHLDAPTVKKDGRTDINDIYVFHPGTPQDLSRTVLAMTVNPAAGVISGTEFGRGMLYDFLVDRNGDAVEDMILRVGFSAPGQNGRQRLAVKIVDPRQRRSGPVIARGLTESVIDGAGGVKVFAGLRDDPFFFDLNSFNDGATFCQTGDTDFFLGLNTSAIVIQLPTEWIGSGQVGVWGRTFMPGVGQVDRMGRPAILTVFLPPNPFEPSPPGPMLEDAFKLGQPANDQAAFRNEVVNSLTLLFSLNDPAKGGTDNPADDAMKIQGLADVLLPDILIVDLSMPTGFLNGRNPADDVIDAELGLITEGAVTSDCINNDSTFLPNFPYLGVPNS